VGIMRHWSVAVLLLVAACSGSSTPGTTTPSPTHTVVVSQSPVPLPTIVGTPVNFSLPGGKIACELQPAYARCDIRSRTWTAPKKPSDCHYHWGSEVEFSVGGKASFACWFGASPLGAKRVLPFGQALQVGLVTCRARTTGVTCSADNHGFTLGRTSYTLR
jgi:hypothetical protein